MNNNLLLSLSIFVISIFYVNSAPYLKGEKTITSTETEEEIKVYPKLTEDILYTEGLNEGDTIIAENQSGERFELKQELFNGYTVVNLEDYPNGVYTIQIRKETYIYTKRIVKH